MSITAHILKKEHEDIERELVELETIMNSSIINYGNLIHVLKRLFEFWDAHEERESVFFNAMAKKGYTIPIKRINFEHGLLKKNHDHLLTALHSGSEIKTKECLLADGRNMIKELRKHMADEDWILYALPKSEQV